MGTGYQVNCTGSDNIVQRALDIASGGSNEIEAILKDLQGGTHQGQESILGDSTRNADNTILPGLTGADVLWNYNIKNANGTESANVDIKTAAGAMIIDDLMQKISTKVQVAAQLLSTANNIAKTASRIMSQG